MPLGNVILRLKLEEALYSQFPIFKAEAIREADIPASESYCPGKKKLH